MLTAFAYAPLSVGSVRRRFLLCFCWFLPARNQRGDDLPRTRLWRLDIRFICFWVGAFCASRHLWKIRTNIDALKKYL